MAKIEIVRPFPGKNVDALYNKFKQAFTGAGFEVWKSRPIAWLEMARGKEADDNVEGNLSARPGNPAMVSLLLTSSTRTEEELRQMADAILQGLES